MAIFSHFPEKPPGSYRAKNPKIGHFWPISPKRGKSPGPRRPGEGGFTSTPRAGAPRFPAGGLERVWRPGAGFPVPGDSPGALPGPRIPGSPAGNRGAPARGVDVKPPSRGRPRGSPGPRDPGTPGQGPPPGAGPREAWDPRIPGSPDPGTPVPGTSGTPSRGPRGLPAPSRGVVLHQPLAAGPRGPAGGTPLEGVGGGVP